MQFVDQTISSLLYILTSVFWNYYVLRGRWVGPFRKINYFILLPNLMVLFLDLILYKRYVKDTKNKLNVSCHCCRHNLPLPITINPFVSHTSNLSMMVTRQLILSLKGDLQYKTRKKGHIRPCSESYRHMYQSYISTRALREVRGVENIELSDGEWAGRRSRLWMILLHVIL